MQTPLYKNPAHRIRVKICCISTHHEANLALSLGADALGFVSQMPSGPGVIAEDTISSIVQSLPPAISSFLLTSHTDVQNIIAQQQRCRATTIQLCDDLKHGTYADLRAALPTVKLVQTIHVQSEKDVRKALVVAPYVDALLLDSGRPDDPTPSLGGTGQTHDWTLSRRIRDLSPRPLFLAGGLRSENIAEAIHAVQPYGVDLCSGVRTNGQLDPDLLRSFLHAVHSTTHT